MNESLASISVAVSALFLGSAGVAEPQEAAEVFAPGVVSVPGDNLYRGAFSPDASEFYFFRKVAEGREDYRIFVTRMTGGEWQPPGRVDLGGEHSDLYPAISPDDRHMVFTSYRPVPGDTSDHPNANLYIAERRPGGWSEPQILSDLSILGNYDSGPAFQRDGSLSWISTLPDWRTRLYRRAPWTESGFGTPQPDSSLVPWLDWRADARVWDAVLSPDGGVAVLSVSRVAGEGRPGPPDLWVSFRNPEGGWSVPRPLSGGVNTGGSENFQIFTPDGSRLMFVRDFETYYSIPLDAAIASP